MYGSGVAEVDQREEAGAKYEGTLRNCNLRPADGCRRTSWNRREL